MAKIVGDIDEKIIKQINKIKKCKKKTIQFIIFGVFKQTIGKI